ncbi:MAG: right-handed parallel beta-helix repeat-containing protein [Bacteroidia bacterium]
MIVRQPSGDPLQIKKQSQLTTGLVAGGLLAVFVLLLAFGSGNRAAGKKSIQVLPNVPDTMVSPAISSPDPAAFQTLAIQVDYKGMQKLRQKKQEAIEKGVLMSNDEDWVDGVFSEGESLVPIKMRLKGDWLDHVRGKKQSFRIQVKQAHSWNRMHTFSVQTPLSRDFLSEWVYHQWLQSEGLLSTRYDFIRFTLNGEPLGVYAYEEHFEKHLPEYNHRREGPIVRFDETAVWQHRQQDLENGRPVGTTEGGFHAFEAADITPFQEGRTAKDTVLKKQFEVAQKLLFSFKYGLKPATEVFDIPKTARYFALLDVAHAWHSLIWHNQRFYFNPLLERLEPIGFDGYTMDGEMRWMMRPFLGYQANHKEGYFLGDLLLNLFDDSTFTRTYIHELERLSDTTRLKTFLTRLEPEIARREEFLRQDFPDYTYNRRFLKDNAKNLRMLLYPFDETAVSIRTQNKTQDRQMLMAANKHGLPLQLVGTGEKSERMTDTFARPTMLPAFIYESAPDYHAFEANIKAKYVFFALPGIDSLFSAAISPWETPGTFIQPNRLSQDLILDTTRFYQVKGRDIIFPPGDFTVNKHILIPQGYRVYFSPGLNMNMIKGSAFISRSPVFAYGNETQPIQIKSSDGLGQGITILQAGEQSELNFVAFEGLNTLNHDGWQLTGAVTFYESPVRINRCSFVNNHCEDALNIVRTEFEISNSYINRTAFDGLDVDFSKGKIVSCEFTNISNDGMDFSGSIIDVVDCQVIGAGDKGISIGEESQVLVQSAKVANATTGIAAKDLSKAEVRLLILENCQTGIAAYRKKPEYGPAEIEVKKYEAKAVNHLHLIEKGSRLILEGKETGGL